MRGIHYASALVGLLALGACKELNVPDLNNPGLEDLETNPTPAKIATAAQGLLIGARAGIGAQNGYVSLLGILGRESYNFDPADPRFITEMLIGPLDGGSPAFGANLFLNPYQNIRNAHILLRALDSPVLAGLTTQQKDAVRGYAKTIQALDFLQVIVTRDINGAPIAVDVSPTGDPAPIESQAAVYAHIVQLLDDAKTHLLAAGTTGFPFQFSSGFDGFNTPAAFLKFNRAIKARVEVYRGGLGAVCGAAVATCYNEALTALGESFIDPAASLRLGVYHSYSTGSGDVVNAIFDPVGRAILAHPSIEADAQLQQPGGPRDQRYLDKVKPITSRTVQGITTDKLFSIYNTNQDPIPIIRNEELILLRAEANLGLGSNLALVVNDINTIRTRSGGLAVYAGAVTPADLLNELLYNKRYSLLFEGGHRWIDLRRYGRLTDVPLDLITHTRQVAFPFPDAECLARGSPSIPGC